MLQPCLSLVSCSKLRGDWRPYPGIWLLRSQVACNYAVRGLSSLARIIGLSVTVTIRNSLALSHQWKQTDWQLIWMPSDAIGIFFKRMSSDIAVALSFKGHDSLIPSYKSTRSLAREKKTTSVCLFVKFLWFVPNHKRFGTINIYNAGQRARVCHHTQST